MRLVELVEELMLRQQEIAGLVQRLYRAFIDITATIIQSIIVPARGGAAVTSFFGDMLVKPEKKEAFSA